MFSLRHLSQRIIKQHRNNVIGPVLRLREYHVAPCRQCKVTSDQIHQKRQFSKVTDSVATEVYFEEIFEYGFEGEDPLFDLRNYFYPESKNEAVIQLSNADCVAEVLDIINAIDHPQHQHITQAVATLHHLMKLSGFVGQSNFYEDFYTIRNEFNNQLKKEQKFLNLCDTIQQNLHKFPNNELGFIYMALSKFTVELTSPLMNDIYLLLMDQVDTVDSETLSYMSVGLRERGKHNFTPCNLWRFGLLKAIPRLDQLLDDSDHQSLEKLRQIVICFYNMSFLISDKMMAKLSSKVLTLIEQGELAKFENMRLLTKLMNFVVTKHDWHNENSDYTLKLLKQFSGQVKHLRPVNTTMLCKYLKSTGEPVSILYEVYDKLLEILKSRSFIGNEPLLTVLAAILSINPSAVPVKHVEEILENALDNSNLSDHVDDVFNIMRNVGIISNDLVDRFFLCAFDALKDDGYEITRFADRYTNMHSVFTGLYINRQFEEKVVEFITDEMQSRDPSVFTPKAFGIRIAILINFGQTLSPSLIKKLEDFLSNINARLLMRISKAIDHQLRRVGPATRATRNEHVDSLEKVSVLVNKASEAKIKKFERDDSSENILDMADLMRNYCYRNDFFDDNFDLLKQRLIKRVDEGNVSAKTVGSMCAAINNPRQKLEAPDLLDCFVNYYLERPDPKDLHADCIYKLLEICFDSGHVPDKRFLDLFCEILLRDIDSLSGLRTLTVAFMLCCYEAADKSLITAIFSNEFMARLDNEIELSSDRRHYPKILRRSLMTLNRAVVLRYPEFGVPWFHKKYCLENEIHLRTWIPKDPKFKDEVGELMSEILGGWRFYKESTMTQFANFIDFEVHYANGKPLDLTSASVEDDRVTKVAVQVLPVSMMTVDTRNLAGFIQSNNKELELQGYRVASVNPFTWNSLQLGDKNSKTKYLQSIIHTELSKTTL